MTEPQITTLAAHISAGSNLPVSRIVIHATSPGLPPATFPLSSSAGMARSTASYFHQESSGGSAHYVEDVTNEEHCVPDYAVAWHAPPNPGSIGVEICAEVWYSREQWLGSDVWPAVTRAAARAAELAARFGVPTVRLTVGDLRAGRRGVCGHWDVSLAFQQSDHTDPGPNFPWDHFMAEVLNAAQEVKPMFDPALTLEPVVASLRCPTGGVWLLAASGAVYAFECPYKGAANGKDYFAGRSAARLELNGDGYTIVATSGERYDYP